MKRLVMEGIGTFFLVLALGFGSGPLAVGIMLMAMIYMGEHISGAHFNPAVTLTAFYRRKITLRGFFEYTAAQIAGAFAAACFFYAMTERIYYMGIPNNMPTWKAGIMEILATFIFCSIVIAVTNVSKLKGTAIYGIVIGLTLVSIASISAQISGACFNPAICLGSGLFDFMLSLGHVLKDIQATSLMAVVNENAALIKQTLMYILAPSCGAYLAAHCWRYLNNEK